jgi:citrate synthase
VIHSGFFRLLAQRRPIGGIIHKAIGIPINMFTVMFALGRLPGWIANWKETSADFVQREGV